AGVPNGWSRRPVTLVASARDDESGMSPTPGGPQPFTAIRVDGGSPVTAAGANVSATVIGSGMHTVAYYARDAAGNADDGATANGQPNREPRSGEVLIDRDPPALAFATSQD